MATCKSAIESCSNTGRKWSWHVTTRIGIEMGWIYVGNVKKPKFGIDPDFDSHMILHHLSEEFQPNQTKLKKQISTTKFRSWDLWVMSPTRFPCAMVLMRLEHPPGSHLVISKSVRISDMKPRCAAFLHFRFGSSPWSANLTDCGIIHSNIHDIAIAIPSSTLELLLLRVHNHVHQLVWSVFLQTPLSKLVEVQFQ